MRVTRLLGPVAVSVLAAAGLAFLSPPPASAAGGACPGATGVTVVVDFNEPAGGRGGPGRLRQPAGRARRRQLRQRRLLPHPAGDRPRLHLPDQQPAGRPRLRGHGRLLEPVGLRRQEWEVDVRHPGRHQPARPRRWLRRLRLAPGRRPGEPAGRRTDPAGAEGHPDALVRAEHQGHPGRQDRWLRGRAEAGPVRDADSLERRGERDTERDTDREAHAEDDDGRSHDGYAGRSEQQRAAGGRGDHRRPGDRHRARRGRQTPPWAPGSASARARSCWARPAPYR
ncbi:hypothetical protein G5V59_24740 [Nocardioides sp. W3-2-3]|uniref:hypothetical protein n=1 Tax=Nocardioides convexus TaxID=2712224 RepID=UPI0024184C36|nr:hypothetical protein [Nocardioides convexus]NHA01809.1 hypothetical protein [Nocardioides convexus]